METVLEQGKPYKKPFYTFKVITLISVPTNFVLHCSPQWVIRSKKNSQMLFYISTCCFLKDTQTVLTIKVKQASPHDFLSLMLTRAGRSTTLLGFCGRSRALLSTVRRWGICTATVPCLASSTASYSTWTPGTPIRPTTIHWNEGRLWTKQWN